MLNNALLQDRALQAPMFGIEFIWQLEDYYEQKNLEKFSSLVSFDFKKGFLTLRERLRREFSKYEYVRLFMHLRSKSLDLEEEVHTYKICWSKRSKKYNDSVLEKKSGRASIVLKKFKQNHMSSFLLYDIQGDNPFA